MNGSSVPKTLGFILVFAIAIAVILMIFMKSASTTMNSEQATEEVEEESTGINDFFTKSLWESE